MQRTETMWNNSVGWIQALDAKMWSRPLSSSGKRNCNICKELGLIQERDKKLYTARCSIRGLFLLIPRPTLVTGSVPKAPCSHIHSFFLFWVLILQRTVCRSLIGCASWAERNKKNLKNLHTLVSALSDTALIKTYWIQRHRLWRLTMAKAAAVEAAVIYFSPGKKEHNSKDIIQTARSIPTWTRRRLVSLFSDAVYLSGIHTSQGSHSVSTNIV